MIRCWWSVSDAAILRVCAIRTVPIHLSNNCTVPIYFSMIGSQIGSQISTGTARNGNSPMYSASTYSSTGFLHCTSTSTYSIRITMVLVPVQYRDRAAIVQYCMTRTISQCATDLWMCIEDAIDNRLLEWWWWWLGVWGRCRCCSGFVGLPRGVLSRVLSVGEALQLLLNPN